MLEWARRFILQHLMVFNIYRRHSVTCFVALAAIILAVALNGCTTLAESQVQNFVPITATSPPPTPTVVWFPPSATPSPQILPTKQPTPEQKPGVGSIVLTDDFSSGADWNTAASDEASVDVSDHQLIIAVQPGILGISLLQNNNFNDFYAEITARPSLCRAGDEYGLLFRAPNNVAYYRFVLSCDGTTRVDRWSVKTPHLLQPAAPSADVPPGAPGEVRLGVWAVGSEFHFFLNDHYQFSVVDRNYRAGGIGVFAVSNGDTPVTITFSDLVVYDVIYSVPTTTPLP
jgi:hypothetical protein